MPSARFIAAITDPASNDTPVFLVTLDHAEFAAPFRWCTAGADLVSNGHTFKARAMEVAPPGEGAEAGARAARLAIDAIEADAVVALRSIQSGRPSALLEIVLAEAPDDVEERWPGLQLIAMRPVGDAIECDLAPRDDGEEEWPVQSFSPSRCPGLF